MPVAPSRRARPDRSLKPLTQYHLESWQTRDGLPTNGIRALAQDADGFLWLGTEAGLVRFDGVEFRTFDRNSTPALKATDVTALFVDNVNRLWIGTDDGAVLRLRDGVFEEFSQVRLSGAISTFHQDQRGVIWVAGGDSVGRVSDNALDPRARRPVRHRRVDLRGRRAARSPSGTTARCAASRTTASGAARTGPRTSRRRSQARRHAVAGPARRACGAPAASGPDRLFTDRRRPAVGQRHGAERAIAAAASGSARPPAWRASSATASSRDRRVRDADFEGMFVTALLEDREGSIWVATRHGGLHQLRDVPFRAITRREGLAHDDVLSVLRGSRRATCGSAPTAPA